MTAALLPNLRIVPIMETTPNPVHTTPEDISPPVEEAAALAFWFSPLHCAIVWRDGPHHLRPAEADKRIRDIQAGDEVFWRGQPRTVRSVAVYR